jgi:hypothetical protein
MRPIKKTMTSNTVIQIREIRLIAIATGKGIMVDKYKVIVPSRIPSPPGAKIAIKPMVHDKIYATATANIIVSGSGYIEQIKK